MKSRTPILWILLVATLLVPSIVRGEDQFELVPIEYSNSTPNNRVSRLQDRIARKEVVLSHDERFGYLPGLLKELRIPQESQMLVFSKTSMQRNRIAPRTPRAIYFNDDTYVGYCHSGNVIELAAADPNLGAVFYTIEQNAASPAAAARQTQSCLQCHATTQVGDIPGLLARSVQVGPSGLPILSEGSHRVDHTTPVKDRWGGWYVTGTHGEQPHLGNLIVGEQDEPITRQERQNIVDLSDRFRTENYLTPHSDIVALMVFEHQLHLHNLLTQANFEARRALFYEADINRAFGELASNRLESTTRRIQSAGDKLLEGLLLVKEASISAPISGTSRFTELFSRAGPRDAKGRSLRDFDLKSRMFKYPCSYLIYSPAFDRLPEEMKSYVATRLHKLLTGQDGDPVFAHLSANDRKAIFEILEATKPDLWSR
jgi:hypothetical protein